MAEPPWPSALRGGELLACAAPTRGSGLGGLRRTAPVLLFTVLPYAPKRGAQRVSLANPKDSTPSTPLRGGLIQKQASRPFPSPPDSRATHDSLLEDNRQRNRVRQPLLARLGSTGDQRPGDRPLVRPGVGRGGLQDDQSGCQQGHQHRAPLRSGQ